MSVCVYVNVYIVYAIFMQKPFSDFQRDHFYKNVKASCILEGFTSSWDLALDKGICVAVQMHPSCLGILLLHWLNNGQGEELRLCILEFTMELVLIVCEIYSVLANLTFPGTFQF